MRNRFGMFLLWVYSRMPQRHGFVLDGYYEQITQEEIDSVKAAFSRKKARNR